MFAATHEKKPDCASLDKISEVDDDELITSAVKRLPGRNNK
jgi:hypothetical protein